MAKSKVFVVHARAKRDEPWSKGMSVRAPQKLDAARAYATACGVAGPVVKSDRDMFVIQSGRNDTFYMRIREKNDHAETV